MEVGAWSALAVSGISAAYLIVLTIGIWTTGFSEPIIDPTLAIMEILTLLSAPFAVTTMAALHSCASDDKKVFSIIALAFMVLTAGITMSVHFAELTASRQTGAGSLAWPSTLYAAELLAWDVFLGLSLLFAAQVFENQGLERVVAGGMSITGILCLAGVSGPALGEMQLQFVSVLGYGLGLPIVFFLLARLFRRNLAVS